MIDELAGIPQDFRNFLEKRGLVYDQLTQVDLLAAALGSQSLLFAGPSGTGKSTAARALADFFVAPTRQAILDTRPGWSGSEDLVGQYSVYAKTYAKGPGTDELNRLHSFGEHGTPVVIVEEANLSPMEAYLGPLVTAASATRFEQLQWPLHQQGLKPEALGLPEAVNLRPWPRFFGTVNIDSTAPAPAPKVSGRACVVLLEPPEVHNVLASMEALAPPTSSNPPTPPGAALIGDPRRAWDALTEDELEQFAVALRPLLEELAKLAGNGSNVVSPRDVQRCVLYMSWHVPLTAAAAAGLGRAVTIEESAENALLHFVLPGLSAEQFRKVVSGLSTIVTDDGLLHRRLERLGSGGEGLFGVSPDFWASLS